MGLTIENWPDLIVASTTNYIKNKLTDINPSAKTKYIAWPKLIQPITAEEQGGTSITFTAQKAYAANTSAFRIGGSVTYGTSDRLVQGIIPWRNVHNYAKWDSIMLKVNSSSEQQVVNYIRTEEAASEAGFIEQMESWFWGKPANSNDDVTPYGLGMFIVKNATTGHYGGDPAGFTSGYAGLATATYPGMKNYSGTYTNVTRDDLIQKIDDMAYATDFESPLQGLLAMNEYGKMNTMYYVTRATFSSLKKEIENRNESLGKDLQYIGNVIYFNNNPIIPVPQLDANVTAGTESSGVIYQIDWSKIRFFQLKGGIEKMAPYKPSGMPTTWVRDSVGTYNLGAVNRRSLGVLYYSA